MILSRPTIIIVLILFIAFVNSRKFSLKFIIFAKVLKTSGKNLFVN
jgi:hypothetical protein